MAVDASDPRVQSHRVFCHLVSLRVNAPPNDMSLHESQRQGKHVM